MEINADCKKMSGCQGWEWQGETARQSTEKPGRVQRCQSAGEKGAARRTGKSTEVSASIRQNMCVRK